MAVFSHILFIMKEIFTLIGHFFVTLVKLSKPGGVKVVGGFSSCQLRRE
jgi:hypothetical protein